MVDEERVQRLEERVNTAEREREQILGEVKRLRCDFDRHQKHVCRDLEKGNETMHATNVQVAEITVAFQQFTRWIKWSSTVLITTVLGIAGLLIKIL